MCGEVGEGVVFLRGGQFSWREPESPFIEGVIHKAERIDLLLAHNAEEVVHSEVRVAKDAGHYDEHRNITASMVQRFLLATFAKLRSPVCLQRWQL